MNRSPSSAPRPLRADAVRNRARLLAAARDQIARLGPHVGVDEIAAAAGVAVGTFYRHFPRKEDLVAAVLGDYVTAIAEDAEGAVQQVAAGARAADELVALLHRLLDVTAAVHAIKATATAGSEHSGFAIAEGRARTAVQTLLSAAQHDGDCPRDVTVDDVYLLVTTAPLTEPAAVQHRWLTLVTRALVPPS